jgi:hypothetical protein
MTFLLTERGVPFSSNGFGGWSRDRCDEAGLPQCSAQGSLLQIDIAQIIVDEADEPNSLVDLLDAEALSGQDGRDVDFLSVDADTATGGDEDIAGSLSSR